MKLTRRDAFRLTGAGALFAWLPWPKPQPPPLAEPPLSAELADAVCVVDSGADAHRGLAGYAGRLYIARDTNLVYYDDGKGWHTCVSYPGAVRAKR